MTNKELKLAASYYTSTFYALMKKNKKDLKLKESDQADLVYRSYFIFCIQSMFNLVLFMYSGMRFNFIRDAEINVALFFTVLLLHLTCLPSARDGIAMMKYVLVHNDEFSHPITAFALGLISFATMFSAEVVNISAAQNKKSVDIAIAGFIGFKLIIDLPKNYMESMEEIAPKGLVGKLSLKRSSRAADRPQMHADWLFSSIFVCFNVFVVGARIRVRIPHRHYRPRHPVQPATRATFQLSVDELGLRIRSELPVVFRATGVVAFI